MGAVSAQPDPDPRESETGLPGGFRAVPRPSGFQSVPRSGGGQSRDPSQPRGIRNNNPGNIKLGANWQGLSVDQTDGRFAQFDDPVMGIRAMAKVLNTYQRRHGLRTPRQMISRWAPPSENDVGAYVASVARRSGLDPDRPVDLRRQGERLIAAMIHHENGQQPYDRGTIRRGVGLALRPDGDRAEKAPRRFR